MSIAHKHLPQLAVLVTMLGAGAVLILAACGGNGGGSGAGEEFPVRITDERVSSGQGIYAANCASCHGGFDGEAPPIAAAPSHDAEMPRSHTWHHADRQLFEWILDKPPLATLMPAFRGKLTDEEVRDVIAYIKSEWPDDVRERQEDFSRQYERQFEEYGP